jgi:hypothetical protein
MFNKFSRITVSTLAALIVVTACNPISKFAKNLKKTTYKANPEILAVRGDWV